MNIFEKCYLLITVCFHIKGFKASFRSLPKGKQIHFCSGDGSSIYETVVEYNENVKIVGTIRSYPKDVAICWMKGWRPLKLVDPKYVGSCCIDGKAVLHIKNVTEEDEDEYRIRAIEDFGGKQISDTLKIMVIGGNMISYSINKLLIVIIAKGSSELF